jgi:hypothetical protein
MSFCGAHCLDEAKTGTEVPSLCPYYAEETGEERGLCLAT